MKRKLCILFLNITKLLKEKEGRVSFSMYLLIGFLAFKIIVTTSLFGSLLEPKSVVIIFTYCLILSFFCGFFILQEIVLLDCRASVVKVIVKVFLTIKLVFGYEYVLGLFQINNKIIISIIIFLLIYFLLIYFLLKENAKYMSSFFNFGIIIFFSLTQGNITCSLEPIESDNSILVEDDTLNEDNEDNDDNFLLYLSIPLILLCVAVCYAYTKDPKISNNHPWDPWDLMNRWSSSDTEPRLIIDNLETLLSILESVLMYIVYYF